MPRLFTGLAIPPDLAEELALMRGGLTGARWIDASDYHLTLRFIGDIDVGTAQEIDEALCGIRRKPFTVKLEGLDYFGGDKPRAIVAKVQASPALAELQAEQERLVRRIGLAPEVRRFTPHVTLARMRNASQTAVAHYLGTRGFLSRQFEAESFNLYSARDSVGGGPYVVEAEYPLDADPTLRS
jgi:RNA 2',3'-cyclic 3'-phosphodiesterase